MPESQNIEWKESWSDLYLKRICGFANAFCRAGMIESWGRGIERINQSCREAGIKLPEFKYEQSDLWVVFSLAAQDDLKTGTSEKSSEKSSEKIIALIQDNPHISAKRIAEQLGLTARAIEKQIAQLKANGILKRVGPDKGGYWEVLK